MKLHYLFFSLIIFTSFTIGATNVFAGDSAIPAEKKITSPPADSTIHSQPVPTQIMPTLQNPLKAKNVTELLFSVVDIAIFIGVIIAVLMFIFIGFKFVLAQGDPTALKEARSWFLYAVIGTAILISSKVIVEVIKNTLTSAGVVNEDLFNKNL